MDWSLPPVTRRLAPLPRASWLATALLLVQCAGGPQLAQGNPFPAVDPAVRQSVSVGASRVIVELRLTPPFTPEGDLPDAAAVEAQRRSITRIQSELLDRLKGTSFSVTHRYDGLPLVALEIGSDALRRLEASGDLVSRVQADTPRSPQR